MMNWLHRAEGRFGHFAIHGLLRYVAFLNAVVYILFRLRPDVADAFFFDRSRIMAGEVWRVITYIFIPASGGFYPDWLSAALYIYFLFILSDGLEQAMGAFRLNAYYLLGIIGITAGAVMFGADSTSFLLNNTLLFAFARFYPNFTFNLFFILPIPVKWIAWFDALLLMFMFIGGTVSLRAAILTSMVNFFAFFGGELWQEVRHRRKVAERRIEFDNAVRPTGEPLHLCATCGRSEEGAPELEFRVARDGEEYCLEHLPKAGSVKG